MTHSDDDFWLRPTKAADGMNLPNAEERKKRFARAIARAEFGRFYWKEDPTERLRNAAAHPNSNTTMAVQAPRPKGNTVNVRKG